jgi:hypothetical protein
VTERVLKEFAAPDGRLAVFDRAYGQRRRFSPGSGIFTTNFDSWDSRGSEERWNLFENSFPQALTRLHSGSAASDVATVETMKDLLAIHWVRSNGMIAAREQAASRTFGRYQHTAPIERRNFLAEAFRQETGLVPATQSALEWMAERLVENVQSSEVPRWHSEQNLEYFQAARARFATLDLHIHRTASRDLVIGDSPVLTTVQGRIGAGPHQDIGILQADHVAMPVAPNILITLGNSSPNLALSDDEVDYYNNLQWETFQVWIAAKPDGTADERLKVEAAKRSAN